MMLVDGRLAVAAPELADAGPLALDRARDVAALGFAGIELWTPWQVDAGTAARLRQELALAGLGVACVSSPSHLHGDEGGEGRRLVTSSIVVAEAMGATRVNTYFGHGGEGDDLRAVDAYADAVAPLLDLAAEAGVTIVLENEFDAFGWDPSHTDISRRARSLHRLLTTVDHPNFRLNFDAANFLCAGQDVEEAAALLAPYVAYAHVKDVVRTPWSDHPSPGWKRYTDGANAYQTVSLGTGQVPWPAVLRELAKAGYDGWYTFEPHCLPTALTSELSAARSYLLREAS
jgi:sugar phosphate isomerase/epimerase